MKKSVCIFIFLLLNLSVSYASYLKTFLPKLIEKSELIVYGKIVNTDNEFIKIAIYTKIKGTLSSDTLTVKKFADWTCASRYARYTSGQEAIFCLEKRKGNYIAMGAANEGELITKDDSVYLENYSQTLYTAKAYPAIAKFGKYIQLNLKTVVRGITLYLENLAEIKKELDNKPEGTTVYQYSYIERLPKNDFLAILIDQKRKGYI